jgi:hypothetical protein
VTKEIPEVYLAESLAELLESSQNLMAAMHLALIDPPWTWQSACYNLSAAWRLSTVVFDPHRQG